MFERHLTFILPEDQAEIKQFVKEIRKFAMASVSPSNQHLPHEEIMLRVRSIFEKMGSLGLPSLSVGPEYGGVGTSALGIAASIYELSKINLGPAIFLSVHLMVTRLIANWDKTGSHKKLINQLAKGSKLAAFCLTESNAGSDAASINLKAKRSADGYILNGEKVYISSAGIADTYLVFAKTENSESSGISAFVVDKSTPGISFGTLEHKMGCYDAPIASVRFENCHISKQSILSEEGDGYKIALSGLAGGRINIAAAACGLASQALKLSIDYAGQRKQFGQSISSFQGIQFMLADMAIKTQASILLARHAAYSLDQQPKEILSPAMAKCFASDSAMQVCTDAVQIFGGSGYIEDYPVARLMRDAKMLQIVEGTNQIQRVIISRNILGSSSF